MELLGGKLSLQSERGIGSRFFFSIPLAPAAGEPGETQPRPLRLAPGQSVRVLVVDDHRENREVLGGLLAAVGCEVFQATDGAEALQQTRARHPQIIFMDLLLPGLSGALTTQQILADETCGSPKIVAHTAWAVSRHRDEALMAGCVDFIVKPVSCERLCECLENHLGVVFERDQSTPAMNLAASLNLEQVRLSDELCARLMVAAELHSTTALKACLLELRQQGPAATQLAEEIRVLMRSYDMNSIQRLLERLVIPKNKPDGLKP